MTLNEDGSLEGKVTVTYTGHRGVEWKNRLESLSDARRAEDIKESLKGLHGDAEITNLLFQTGCDAYRQCNGYLP